MRSYKTEGIILKRKNIGEADRILTVFTERFGKIQIKAPGVRKITSKRSAHIELLNVTLLTLYKSSRSQMPIVTEAQNVENFSSLKKDLGKIGFAFYICELVNNFCPENQESQRIFNLIKNTLNNLETLADNSSVVDNFEREFLELLGFASKSQILSDRQSFMENIIEKRLKTKELLTYFIS
ncbi:MAG: DNA repair protein RecO [Candidatus Levybacteria bacterium]|nr:DNA repair protein RecO [Candidatus Levybacteria bacterium]